MDLPYEVSALPEIYAVVSHEVLKQVQCRLQHGFLDDSSDAHAWDFQGGVRGILMFPWGDAFDDDAREGMITHAQSHKQAIWA